MPYRFKLDEPVGRGFRRIARHQLDIALAALTSVEGMPSGVHECRKALKRLRALVRLSEFAIGSRRAKQRLSSLGAIGKLLSERRDQDVLIDTLDKLAAGSCGENADALRLLRLQVGGPGAGRLPAIDHVCREEVRDRLLHEAKKFSRMRLRKGGSRALGEGLEKSYASARKAMKKAHREPTDENYHELRKSIQWHWRQMSVLARAWPDEFGARIAVARELSQILGDEHDLSLVAEYAASTTELEPARQSAVVELCSGRQSALRQAAKPRAERLLAEPPREFARRILTYWRLARRFGAISEQPGDLISPNANLGQPDHDEQERPPPALPSAPKLVATKTAASAQSQRRV